MNDCVCMLDRTNFMIRFRLNPVVIAYIAAMLLSGLPPRNLRRAAAAEDFLRRGRRRRGNLRRAAADSKNLRRTPLIVRMLEDNNLRNLNTNRTTRLKVIRICVYLRKILHYAQVT